MLPENAKNILLKPIYRSNRIHLNLHESNPTYNVHIVRFQGHLNRIAVAGSPGASAMIKNTSADVPIITGIRSKRRFTMYLSMFTAPFIRLPDETRRAKPHRAFYLNIQDV